MHPEAADAEPHDTTPVPAGPPSEREAWERSAPTPPPASDAGHDDAAARDGGPGRATSDAGAGRATSGTGTDARETAAEGAGTAVLTADANGTDDREGLDDQDGTGTQDGSDPDQAASDAPVPAARDKFLLALLGARTLALGATRNDRLWGWLGPALVAVLAGVLRLWRLGHPHELVFDETYYVKDAWSLLGLGYEGTWPDNPNPAFESGEVNSYLSDPSYVVHPQLGKWMIAAGMWLGGADSSFFWRLSTALVGIAAVFLVARVARRLFASTAMGVIAGGLMAIDGEAIVHSRTSLLDNFLMFWALVAFWCILRDREQSRRRLAEKCGAIVDAGGVIGKYGPRLGWRWWRFAAAVSLGFACGIKWSGLYFLAVFALLSVLWDASARRKVGVKRWWEDTFVVDAIPAALVMLPTALVAYVASWFSWFRADNSYMRNWAVENPGQGPQWLPEALRSFWEYHVSMWNFHTGLVSDHPYKSEAYTWIVQWRPTSFYYQSYDGGTGTCGQDRCVEAITSLGNPLLWWLGALALVATIALLVRFKDWRATAVLSGFVAGWVPWLVVTDRTIFTFYSIAFTPWVVLAVVYVMAVAVERTEGRVVARAWTRTAIAVVLALIVAVSVYFFPIWTGMQVPYDFWHQHMWLQSWI
ncbi:dolichyl-phosphate-mannose-protein mannosyltransferase [Sediminihabitans luteus]|uniref:Polyprenol-phosphate-mannose--protein mannosyltransferase n=1 Tax=Sediminihabitans luteus TaxID=1138585 RepID=A0A2M9CDW4_9CELL|nr:phospholipid carrier-dependent glycosyltransferase [Sediminihabitans luteus]PJJ70121.1 dolichyl-phosphate-mannose-protein mannosyltransferase [Sediminihabitans luteus]GIJ00578.1 dolichyl-phosphate-mannose--protein mannosyltransferase [Sediminihabitans luteus]